MIGFKKKKNTVDTYQAIQLPPEVTKVFDYYSQRKKIRNFCDIVSAQRKPAGG